MAIEKHLYYWSNDSIPFDTVEMTTELEGNQYPLVVTPPEGLKSPKFDWSSNTWVENDSASQGQQIAELVKSVKALNKDSVQVNKENDELKETLKTIQQGQQQTTMMFSQLMPLIQQLGQTTKKDGDK